ncbi:PREDICTED: F-box/kelch-repeat protein At3g23880-like [Fragaria vesca subsp. vesca]|uniref:F-box/kelch-repeat protein At3g23880-like n=1 Tax=Fragaria vesca subsp. vesca TaxID=101020 RepID=UPI0002C355A9|nr:PREDICTED: F-box/kelch-repeat protein At3g23880-like [Fragaria vesca subsp. vesca]
MSEYSTKKKRSSENFRLLPVEITTDIMLRLPLKSLLTCTAVCKSWNSLFKSLFKTSDFIEDHLNATIQFYRQNDVHNLLIRKQVESYSLYRHNPSELGTSDQHIELPYPSKFKADLQSFHDRSWLRRMVGTCNGLVCLAGATEDITIIIWNPTVRKFVILPRPVDIFNYDENPRQTHHAFGHDPRNYKVLRIVSDRKEEPAVRVEVYSLARGSWRSLLAAAVPACFKPADESSYFINGASHWIQKTRKRVGKRRVCNHVVQYGN